MANTVTNIADLIKTFQTTGGSTQTQSSTQSTTVTPEAIQAAIKAALEGNNGLAAISGGQKGAGVYNSTVQTQLVNDLMTRAAAEAAAKSTTTTQNATTVNSGTKGGLASKGAMGVLAGLQALSPEGGISTAYDKIMQMASGSGTANAASDAFSTAVTAAKSKQIADALASTSGAITGGTTALDGSIGGVDLVGSLADNSYGAFNAIDSAAPAIAALDAVDTASTASNAVDVASAASDSSSIMDTITSGFNDVKDWWDAW